MIDIKAFGVLHQLANNTIGEVSTIGEMSASSESYSREKGHFAYDDLPGIKLHTLSSKDENGLRIQADPGIVREMAEVLKWVSDRVLAGTLINDKPAFLTLIRQVFGPLANNWNCGNIVYDGTYFAPEWVSWSGDNNLDPQDDIFRKFWLVDGSFQVQFPEYEYIFTSPLVAVDDFHKSYGNVTTLLVAEGIQDLVDRAIVDRDNIPATQTPVLEFWFYDKDDITKRTMTYWPVGLYGGLGKDADTTRTALAKWILSNSLYSEFEWNRVLPDLFTPTEFVIVPQWNDISLINVIGGSQIYRPISTLATGVSLMEKVAIDYTPAHLAANLTYMAFIYKSIGAYVIGSEDNRDDIFMIQDQWSDYILVSNTSPDFARMAPTTQQWVTQMHSAFKAAEEFDGMSNIPVHLALMERNGFTFITFKYESINFNILTRKSLQEYYIALEDN